jgi:ATP-dependent Clp protease ATP-binding subunit ClpB
MNKMPEFSEKASSVLQQAQSLAIEHSHPQLSAVHLACALVDEKDQLFARLVNLQNQDIQPLSRKLMSLLVKIPSQTPAVQDISGNASFNQVILKAQQLQKQLGDNYLSIDHLILGLWSAQEISKVLKECNVSYDSIQASVTKLRGNRKMETPTSDGNFDSLNKYAVDLLAKAREGKIDPVIGRDNEIRRIIRVLARRSKNNPVLIGEPGVLLYRNVRLAKPPLLKDWQSGFYKKMSLLHLMQRSMLLIWLN